LEVVFESQAVAVVPKLVPVTSTATYLLRWAEVSLNVLRVAPVIAVQVDGTVLRAAVTALVQAYHWYLYVGAGVPLQVPGFAVIVRPIIAVPVMVGFIVAVARVAITTGLPPQVEPQPVVVGVRVTEVRLVLSNTLLPAVGAFPKKVTEVRRELAENAKLPMLVTEFGMVTAVRSLL
jgi:hypothetical protein